jgi:hypothetical protein
MANDRPAYPVELSKHAMVRYWERHEPHTLPADAYDALREAARDVRWSGKTTRNGDPMMQAGDVFLVVKLLHKPKKRYIVVTILPKGAVESPT